MKFRVYVTSGGCGEYSGFEVQKKEWFFWKTVQKFYLDPRCGKDPLGKATDLCKKLQAAYDAGDIE